MLTPTKINGEQYLSHEQIANFVYQQSVKLHGKPNGQPAMVKAALTTEIKDMLCVAHTVPVGSLCVIRRGLDVLADRSAFFSLAQHYDWDEEIVRPVLTALGEYGEIPAQELMNELNNQKEEAA